MKAARRAGLCFADSTGYTLIELLVSMAIVTLVGVVLSSIVVLGLGMSRTFHYEDQRVYPVRDAYDLILKDLRLTTEYYANCGVTGRQAFSVHNGTTTYAISYQLDTATHTLNRVLYKDEPSCSTLVSSRPVAYQIDALQITDLTGGKFELLLQGRSQDNKVFTLRDVVIGRVLGRR